MKDDFLYRNRPPVRKAFSDNLYQRLSSRYPDGRPARKGAFLVKAFLARPGLWKYALLFVLVVAALTLTLSEPVRAKALEWVRNVAGFTVEERSQSPLDEITGAGLASPQAGEAPAARSALTQAQPTVYAVPTVTLPEALHNPPFAFDLPAWVPAGFTLDEQAAIASSRDWIILTWSHSNGIEIEMLVEREYNGYSLPTGEDSSQEVQI